tara:strand:+ start:3180 stop:3287 length:108 start_codon:yes stop_codon:yes gene_type:complete
MPSYKGKKFSYNKKGYSEYAKAINNTKKKKKKTKK